MIDEQESFWSGDFGDDYATRNQDLSLLASNFMLFSEIFSSINQEIDSILEIGANIGMNISPMKTLFPNSKISAVEINQTAIQKLKETQVDKIYPGSISDLEIDSKFDLVITKGVLIHINPDNLINVYKKMYALSKKYILVAEYYSPHPVAVEYRNHSNKLFKRDFAGEMLDLFDELRLVKCGFAYHKSAFPQDDITWFLLEKLSSDN